MVTAIVGCGNINQNDENSNSGNGAQESNTDDNFWNELFKDEYVDEDYEPNMKGLGGIAVYQVPKGEDYPFEVEQQLLKSDPKYYGFNKWERFYFDHGHDGVTYIKSKQITYTETWENDLKTISVSYTANREQIYWGGCISDER